MSLCSITGGRKLLGWRKKGDDRPFVKQKKPVLPIRGFKGNRVIYGDIFDVEDENLQATPFEQDYQNKDIKSAEPFYSEPYFPINIWDSPKSDSHSISCKQSEHPISSLLASDLASLRLPSVSSPESGYSSAKPSSSSQGYTSRETSDDDDDQFSHFHTGTGHHTYPCLTTMRWINHQPIIS